MEGVGLFTIANYRQCSATGIYVITDVFSDENWKLGWEGSKISDSVEVLIDMIMDSVC